MKYEIRSPIATSAVELIRVADAMAVAEATLLLPGTSGETELHRSTYEGRFNHLIDLLLTEAQRGKLRVCDVDGRESTMSALVADRLGVTCQDLTYDSFHLAAMAVYTRPAWLTEWRNDDYVLIQVPPSASCEQGFIGGGILGAPSRTGKPPGFVPEQAPAELPDPQRRLAALSALGGKATRMHGKWSFTKINELTVSEKGRPRSSPKTIRRDLIEAAEAEHKEGPKPLPPSLFPT